MILALLKASLAQFLTEEGLALGLLAVITASTVDAYLWLAPSFVIHGSLIGGSLVGMLWIALQPDCEAAAWDI